MPYRVRVPACLDKNMKRRVFLCRSAYCVAGASVTVLSGCGTLMHPERRGQYPTGRLDWRIVAADGLCLLLFFVPGVVAFAVDFYTGAIYLPRGRYSLDGPHHNSSSATAFKKIRVPEGQLDRQRIEQVVSGHVGHPISLTDNKSRFSRLSSLEDFPIHCRRHHQNPQHGCSCRLLCQRV